MTVVAALRVSKHAFGPVRRTENRRAWTYTSILPTARIAMSRDREAVARIRNREIIRQACLLMGWEVEAARFQVLGEVRYAA